MMTDEECGKRVQAEVARRVTEERARIKATLKRLLAGVPKSTTLDLTNLLIIRLGEIDAYADEL